MSYLLDASYWTELALRCTAELMRLFLSPGSRTYWLFLLVSLLAAWWLRRRELRTGAALPSHLDVFSQQTWFGRSAMNDYWLILINATVFGGAVALVVPDASGLANQAARALDAYFPTSATVLPMWAPIVLALALFVADDAARYGLHWLEHRVPILWELHKVHHSAEVLNFLTAERHHPLSIIYFQSGIVLVAATVNGAFLWMYGSAATPKTLLGANAFWIAASLLASSLRHSPAWLSFGPVVERWLLSPAQHQIHHSQDPRHFGKNLGGSLAIWDRLFGTLLVTTSARIPVVFGLGSETSEHRSIASLYLRPLARIGRRLWPLEADVGGRA